MPNVPDFWPEKNEFEEFSLQKANVATLAPESKPNVYSEQHCATKEIRPYWRIFCLENQVHFFALKQQNNTKYNPWRRHRPGPPNLPSKLQTHRIWSTIFSKGPIFHLKKRISIQKVGRSEISGGAGPPLFQTGGAGPPPPLAPMVATQLTTVHSKTPVQLATYMMTV